MLRRNQGVPGSPSSGKGDLANFKLVRKGYDVEQVDAFLLTQATAWSTELAQARQENADLHAQIARRAQDVQAVSRSVQEQPPVHPTPPIQQTDVEIIARAETTAARIVAEADQQAQTRVRAALRAQEEVLNQRQEDLDARFARTKAQYEEILSALNAKVGELQETREALVDGLETIAAGGLAAIEGLSNELPPTNLTKPAELARPAQPELADARPRSEDNNEFEAELAAKVRAVAKEAEKEEEGEFDPLTPAPVGIAEPTFADTATAEAHMASAEDQLASTEAHLASLAEQLGKPEPLVASPEDQVTGVSDDTAGLAQSVAEPNGQDAPHVPPSILGEPGGFEAEPATPVAETEGFQSSDGEAELDDAAGQENDSAADTEDTDTDTDTDPEPAGESTDDGLADPEPIDGKADNGWSNGDRNVSDSDQSLEQVAASLTDTDWPTRTISSPTDHDAVAAPASSLATTTPEADTAEHPIASTGSTGFVATSFPWNKPSS